MTNAAMDWLVDAERGLVKTLARELGHRSRLDRRRGVRAARYRRRARDDRARHQRGVPLPRRTVTGRRNPCYRICYRTW